MFTQNYSSTSVNSILVGDEKESLHPEWGGTAVKNCGDFS